MGLNINDVVEILSWNGVCVNNEEPIFSAAIRWLEKDRKLRHQFAERFLIHYHNIPIEIFLHILYVLNAQFVLEHFDAYKK